MLFTSPGGFSGSSQTVPGTGGSKPRCCGSVASTGFHLGFWGWFGEIWGVLVARAVPNIRSSRQDEGRDALNSRLGHSPSSSAPQADVQGNILSPDPLKCSSLTQPCQLLLFCLPIFTASHGFSMKILVLPSRVPGRHRSGALPMCSADLFMHPHRLSNINQEQGF